MSPTGPGWPIWVPTGCAGLLRATAPDPELRDLPRARTIITRNGPGRSNAWRQALLKGQDDPAALAELAERRMRSKNPELTDAMTGRFTSHHRNSAELYLHWIYAHTADIEALSARIEEAIAPFVPPWNS